MAEYKILHLIGGGEIGGAEQHVLSLLTNLNKTIFDPRLICLTKGSFAQLAASQGIPSETFPMSHPLDLSLLPSLIRWSRREKINLLHTHGSRANLLGRIAARFLKVPCISTVHSSLAQDYLSPWSASIALFLDRMTLPLTTGIITVSDFLAQEVARRGGKNILTIYNGQKPLIFNNKEELRSSYRAAYHIPDDKIVVGCIARLHPTKGISYLIKALDELNSRKSQSNLHFLLVGDGPLHQILKTELNQTSLTYTMTGFLPQAYQALPAMDLFVLPSINEGMGIVLLEAMQAGIPIISTTAGGIPELLRSEQDALLVPPADPHALTTACEAILTNKELAERLTASALERSFEFSIQNMTEQVQNLYHKVLEGNQL